MQRLRPVSCAVLALSAACLLCTPLAFGATTHNPDVTFLDPHGPIAAAQRQHFINVILLMMIVILPVLIGTPLLAWRYRYHNASARYAPKWEHSWKLEVLIWAVPLAVVSVLSIWLANDTTKLDPYLALKTQGPPLKVDVIGYDWKWLFVYPQLHIASVGQLVFPRNQQLDIRLTSDTVMQSFLIPTLGSQIYAMAGMRTRLHLVSNSVGQFLGENTQYNGMGFQKDRFIAHATTLLGFQDWVASVKAHGVTLTPSVYKVIRKDNTVSQIRTALKADHMPPDAVFFNRVNPDLFGNVVMSFHGGASSSSGIVDGHSKNPMQTHVAALAAHPDGHPKAATE